MAPSASKLNVLVYSGPGATYLSVKNALFTLRKLLQPNHAVTTVTDKVLCEEPWQESCALLVFPGGADLLYCKALNGRGNDLIKDWVRSGGSYLGFCAGGYYGSAACEFEVDDPVLKVVGERELAFFPSVCRGLVFKGYVYGSEKGARAALIRSTGLDATEFRCYYNGGGVFVDADSFNNDVENLAEYAEDIAVDSGAVKSAIVYCKVGKGHAILAGPHPEFDAIYLDADTNVPGYNELVELVRRDTIPRALFLGKCLKKLGLSTSSASYMPKLTVMHLSALSGGELADLMDTLPFSGPASEEGIKTGRLLKGETDAFHFLDQVNSELAMGALAKALPKEKNQRLMGDPLAEDYVRELKKVVVHDKTSPTTETPEFDHGILFTYLNLYRACQHRPDPGMSWGNIFMYGEVVTSTNSLLDRNHKLLEKLPTGFTLAATTQILGRGRGSNFWIAPPGCLIMSTVVNHPGHLLQTRHPVFLTYLAALAVVEATRTYDDNDAYRAMPIKIKWPNDIVARNASDEWVKIGGVLASSHFRPHDAVYQIVVGIGLNVKNPEPTTSVNQILKTVAPKEFNKPCLSEYTIERLMAKILCEFEFIYGLWCRDGFGGTTLEKRFYRSWLHTDAVVRLEAVEGQPRAMIRGITSDYGMLEAEEMDEQGNTTRRFFNLQSNENSFNYWKGLIKKKL